MKCGQTIALFKDTAKDSCRLTRHLQVIYCRILADIEFRGAAAEIAVSAWQVEHGFKGFSRWCSNGVWRELFGYFSEQADFQDVSIEGSVVRVHVRAAGSSKKYCNR